MGRVAILSAIGVVLAAGAHAAGRFVPLPVQIPFYWLGLNFVAAAMSHIANSPAVYGKNRQTGGLGILYSIFWLPLRLLMIFNLRLYDRFLRSKGLEGACEVSSNIWISSYCSMEKAVTDSHKSAIVDVTAELPKGTGHLCTRPYMCPAALDGFPPEPAEIHKAALFIREHVNSGHRVVVHCAFGIGRSTTVACAGMVLLGRAADWEEAFNAIKKKRRIVRLTSKYKAALRKWTEDYALKSK
eukprot:Clim_evm29s11 gene=Clim_evmTU29s11